MLVNGETPPYLWHTMLVQEQHCAIYLFFFFPLFVFVGKQLK